jgi:hypothetical protein
MVIKLIFGYMPSLVHIKGFSKRKGLQLGEIFMDMLHYMDFLYSDLV